MKTMPIVQRQMSKTRVSNIQTRHHEMAVQPSSQTEQNGDNEDETMGIDSYFLPLTDECYHFTKLGDLEFDTQK